MTSKQARLEKTLLGEATDRTPVALWRYFPGDDLRAADFARAIQAYQQQYDWDFINLTPAPTVSVAGFGVQTEWQGHPSGRREIIRHMITRSLHWTDIRPIDPLRGETGKMLETLQLITTDDTPVIATVYSPLTQAAMLAGHDLMLRHMRTEEDRFRTGMNAITENTMRLIDSLRRVGIVGIYYVMSEADFVTMSEAEYQAFGVPYDRKVLESCPDRWWLNILHVGRLAPMFDLAITYPLPVIHWDTCAKNPDLTTARAKFSGAFCLGVEAEAHLNLGTPTVIKTIARQIQQEFAHRRLILGANDVVPVTAPWSNLWAVREAVEVMS
ncbi:MAG: hypothetical protein Kow00117_05730 [Phototrophicales bacterium]